MQEQTARSSFAIMKRSYDGGYLSSHRERWDILSTQTALYSNEDLFDNNEIERRREAVARFLAAIKFWRVIFSAVMALLLVGAAWLSIGDGVDGAFRLFLVEALPVGQWAAPVLPLIAVLVVAAVFGAGEVLLQNRLRDASEEADHALNIKEIGRQLYLNAGTLRFAFGDAGLLVEGDRVEGRHKWRDFREAVMIGGEFQTHIRLVLEHDRRNEFIIVPRRKFFPGTDGVSWQTFLEMLKRHVQSVGF
ncbi:MAG: hypothetical protein AAFR65_07775 [Pseudomonadota bacterium]